MRFGIALQARYAYMRPIVEAAEELGYESVWIPDHLILPATIGEVSPIAGQEHPPIDPSIPTLDNLMVLVEFAGATESLRLGTWVYNLALRHPFVAARATQTLDLISGGRLIFGVGAGWIPGEYEATGIDFSSRGRRLEESVEILRRLWCDPTPSHDGEFYRFPPVRFEPKPVQQPIPIHIGGDSPAALKRAARIGDGWVGSWHDPDSARQSAEVLEARLQHAERDRSAFEITVSATPRDVTELEAFAAAGVDRLLVSPWERSRGAVAGLTDYARWLKNACGIDLADAAT